MQKEHKKMYKAGKRWVTALLTATTLGIIGVDFAGNQIAHADTPSTDSSTSSDSNASSETNNASSASSNANNTSLASSTTSGNQGTSILSQANSNESGQSISSSNSNNGSNNSTAVTYSSSNDNSTKLSKYESDYFSNPSSFLYSSTFYGYPKDYPEAPDSNFITGVITYNDPAAFGYMYMDESYNEANTMQELSSSKPKHSIEFNIVGQKTDYPQSIEIKNNEVTGTQIYAAYPNDSNNNSPISSISDVHLTTFDDEGNASYYPISSNEYSINYDYPNNSATPQFNYKVNASSPSSTYIAFNNNIFDFQSYIDANTNRGNGGANTASDDPSVIGNSVTLSYTITPNSQFQGTKYVIDSYGTESLGTAGKSNLNQEITYVPKIQVNYLDDSGKKILPPEYFSTPADPSHWNQSFNESVMKINPGVSFLAPTHGIGTAMDNGYEYDHYTTSSNYKVNSDGYITQLNDNSGTDGANLSYKFDSKTGADAVTGTFNSVKMSSNDLTNNNLNSREWASNIINLYFKSASNASSSSDSSNNNGSANSANNNSAANSSNNNDSANSANNNSAANSSNNNGSANSANNNSAADSSNNNNSANSANNNSAADSSNNNDSANSANNNSAANSSNNNDSANSANNNSAANSSNNNGSANSANNNSAAGSSNNNSSAGTYNFNSNNSSSTSSNDSLLQFANSVYHSVASNSSAKNSSTDSSANSSESSASVSSSSSSKTSGNSSASSVAVKYYKMYNNKTTLVKKNHKIYIFIEPKLVSNDSYVVSYKLKNDKISHEQEVTLNQYNSLLSAIGEKHLSKKGLEKVYAKRKQLKNNKTSFIAPVVKVNEKRMLTLNGKNNGFESTTKKQKTIKK